MAQPQHPQQFPMVPRPYSPLQNVNSPGAQQASFSLPPTKRQRLSPGPASQPGSPYVQSPYGMSPNASTTPLAGASPVFPHVGLPGPYTTPYSNGHANPNSNTQSQPQVHQPPQNQQYQGPLAYPNQIQLNQPGNYNNFAMPHQGPGAMGPPSKPVEKSREDGDVMDVLGGTGVDLREEEQYTFQMYNTSFNSQQTGSQSGTISSGHSFTQFPPGGADSMYGSGPANAPAEATNTQSQEVLEKKAADKAWYEAAHNLATSRQRELNNPFLEVGRLHSRMAKLARENGLSLNLDHKGSMGTMRLPEQFSQSNVRVQTAIGPENGMLVTNGNFLSNESQLVDQLALLSIASKHRIRCMIEDASKIAKARRTGAHGVIPKEWADVAVDAKLDTQSASSDGGPRVGWESAISSQSNPLKRPFSSIDAGQTSNKTPTPIVDSNKNPTGALQATNETVGLLRSAAVMERDFEEARLRKRQGKSNPSGDGASRHVSVVPGTPGSVAPEPVEKAPTKKEQKKKLESKANEAASHAAANVTTAQFLGGGGSRFGKKKYSWMSSAGGGPGSGASTPGRGGPGQPNLGGLSQPAVLEKLTGEPARRLGTWREDKEKGVGIQIRDWVMVLEQDGHEKTALQKAYSFLDLAEPK